MEQKYLNLKCQSNPKRNSFCFFFIYAQLAQWLRAYITLNWIFLESSGIQQQSDQHFYRKTTFSFFLQSVLIYNQLMSTKKVVSRLCKLYSVDGEISEAIFDWTDVDSYFYHNNLDISQSHYRLVRVRKVSEKSLSNSKFVDFAIQKGNWLSTRHFGWTSQSSWSSQQTIADSNTPAEISDWIYKNERRTVQSLSKGYSWTFEQTNSIFV